MLRFVLVSGAMGGVCGKVMATNTAFDGQAVQQQLEVHAGIRTRLRGDGRSVREGDGNQYSS